MNISLLSLRSLSCCLFMIKFSMNWKNWDFCICKVEDWSQLTTWSVVSLNQQQRHYLQAFQRFRISGKPQDLLNQTLYFNKIFGWFFFYSSLRSTVLCCISKCNSYTCVSEWCYRHTPLNFTQTEHTVSPWCLCHIYFIIINFPNITERHR